VLLIALLGFTVWTVVSIPVALLLARVLRLDEAAPEGAEVQELPLAAGDVQLECMDLALAVGAGLHWTGRTDQVASARERVRA
jgi:hypothetical protein